MIIVTKHLKIIFLVKCCSLTILEDYFAICDCQSVVLCVDFCTSPNVFWSYDAVGIYICPRSGLVSSGLSFILLPLSLPSTMHGIEIVPLSSKNMLLLSVRNSIGNFFWKLNIKYSRTKAWDGWGSGYIFAILHNLCWALRVKTVQARKPRDVLARKYDLVSDSGVY